ncbi:MAG: hypothetical protein B7X59_07745 [Polaromonas sp. 39-63-203]|jgi:phage terminase Nu1 subunit (DNA packaging protein)|uniref:hypothetical protein n=1 Tax=Polaromonas sp. TaxID=1869339 RepID=UPI000BCE6CFF|nr:hypothetical protein [Polaromonas sp.]OYY52587.1 MAG: hypothetical protein B7Y54_06435 [Polaromonas sp. 35-63-240]OYZ83868.1 MAG: hypothetical protein B7Y03_06905 [Polaromonas sp. 24-62-144]OZA97556.1 MAG: hypothetical protein B7X59_07745 [Polaromonas sp. 39-63-203]HQS33416.1 hypothetical protein [Polaromonas sp.]HQS92319.1 hypothetical protein [Polaromonas sp.]
MVIDLSIEGTQEQLASLVGVSQPTISLLVTAGKLPPVGTLGELMLAYCYRLREQAAGRMGSEIGGLDLVQERAALAREQRLGIEMKNAVLRSEYAPIGLLSEVLATASQSVVERFEQLPGMLKKACPELPEAAREQVMAVLAAARNEWVRATLELVVKRIEDEADDAGPVDMEQDHG